MLMLWVVFKRNKRYYQYSHTRSSKGTNKHENIKSTPTKNNPQSKSGRSARSIMYQREYVQYIVCG